MPSCSHASMLGTLALINPLYHILWYLTMCGARTEVIRIYTVNTFQLTNTLKINMEIFNF